MIYQDGDLPAITVSIGVAAGKQGIDAIPLLSRADRRPASGQGKWAKPGYYRQRRLAYIFTAQRPAAAIRVILDHEKPGRDKEEKN